MKKSKIDDINRNIYDIKNTDDYEFKIKKGLTKEIVEEISKQKNDPDWMREFRLKAIEVYNNLELPTWGPDISELNMDEIATYVKPKTKLNNTWDDVPEDIKNTFDKLGIPEAEKTSLAGVGAQYDSEVVYHSMKEELIKQGVIYTDMETAVKDYSDIVQEHFMKCVPLHDHKFAALHGAVWSGGSFVYVPKGVKVDVPLQSYFRLNSPESGQFEHTLIIVDEGASLHFIEGCSARKCAWPAYPGVTKSPHAAAPASASAHRFPPAKANGTRCSAQYHRSSRACNMPCGNRCAAYRRSPCVQR